MAALECSPAWQRLLLSSLARQANPKTASFVQLATVRADGSPANRTVVYRGFLGGTCRLLFYTDTRSLKVTEVSLSPMAEVCWYMADTWEQFRILGAAEVVTDSHSSQQLRQLRRQSWTSLSGKQKRTWLGPHPGTPQPLREAEPIRHPEDPAHQPLAAPEEPGHRPPAGLGGAREGQGGQTRGLGSKDHSPAAPGSAPETDEPVACFCLLLLNPQRVDYLSIKEDIRSIHTFSSTARSSDLETQESRIGTWSTENVAP